MGGKSPWRSTEQKPVHFIICPGYGEHLYFVFKDEFKYEAERAGATLAITTTAWLFKNPLQ